MWKSTRCGIVGSFIVFASLSQSSNVLLILTDNRIHSVATNGVVHVHIIDWLGLNALIAEAEKTVPAIRN